MHAFLQRLLAPFTTALCCPKRLAQAASLGVYIALSPFFGLHTIMHIVFGWLFNFNIPLLLCIGYTVNNPWTMVPLYTAGYKVGVWILYYCAPSVLYQSNPLWMQSLNEQLSYYTGSTYISLWAFVVGGNVLGVIGALITYPLFKKVFTYIIILKNSKGTE